MPSQERHSAGFGILKWAEVYWFGDEPRGWSRPWDCMRVRVGIEDSQFTPIRLAVLSRVDAHGAAVGAERRFDGRYPCYDIGDGLSARQPHPRPPPPHVHARRLDS